MDTRKNTVLLIAVLLLITGNLVSAATVQFIDSAYIGNGTLKISSPDNSWLTSLNSSESYEMSNGTAYMLDYQPSGFVTLDQESGYNPVTGWNFPTLEFLLAFFSVPVNLISLIVLVLILIIVVSL